MVRTTKSSQQAFENNAPPHARAASHVKLINCYSLPTVRGTGVSTSTTDLLAEIYFKKLPGLPRECSVWSLHYNHALPVTEGRGQLGTEYSKFERNCYHYYLYLLLPVAPARTNPLVSTPNFFFPLLLPVRVPAKKRSIPLHNHDGWWWQVHVVRYIEHNPQLTWQIGVKYL